MKELSQNTTLKEVTKEGKPSIAEQVKKIACVNECSGNGVCLNGKLKTTMKKNLDSFQRPVSLSCLIKNSLHVLKNISHQ